MKIVSLCGPAVIAGAVRYPIEGPLTVSDDEAHRLWESGRLDGEPEDLPEESAEDEGDELDSLKVADLKDLAAKEEIDLGEAKAKSEIISAIRAAREAA